MSNTSEQSVDLTSKPLTTISGHEYSIRRIECLPGGTRIVTCSFDDTVRIWNVETGEQEGMSIAHEGCVYGLAVTKDGKRVLSGGEDKRIRVWDVESGELVEEWESHLHSIYHIALSPNGRLAASGGDQGEIVMRRVEEGGRRKYSIDAGGNSGHGYDAVLSLCFSPSGEKLACAVGNMVGKPGVITVYDAKTGELVVGPIQGHEDVVCSVLWSLDGPRRLFSASYDHTIRCWNSDTGEPIGEPWQGHTGWVESLSLSPDGTKLASSSYDKTIRYWDARSGDPINQPLQHEELSAVTFSPSGEFVTVARDNKVSRLCVPRWNDSQKRAHQYSFLDLPAVPGPNDQHQYVEFLDLLPRTEEVDPPGMNPQLRQVQRHRQIDDVVVEKRKADPESDLLEREAKRLRSPDYEIRQVQHPGILTGSSTADSSTGNPPAFEPSIADIPWTLHDIRPIYPRDLTGHVVREGGEPFTSGGFGDVYRGKLCLSERSIDVAVKVMKTYLIDDGNDRDKKNMKLCREFQTWADLKHFNILPLFGLTTDFKQFPAMVCPWLENGSLTSYLERRNDTLTIMERLALLGDAAAGLQYLHSQSVVHGDLSGSNVLIDGNGKACISDFGLSVLLAELGGSTYTNSCHVGGAVRWIAPELLDHEVPGDENKPLHLFPTLQSDVYSFGMVILQVLTGKVPYHYIVPVARVQSAILHRKIPLRPQQQLVTDSQWKFMQRCWMPVGVPEPRPRSDEIVEFVRQELDACRESLMELT